MPGGPEVAHHTFMRSVQAGSGEGGGSGGGGAGGGSSAAATAALFERKVAPSLTITAQAGNFATSSLAPLCALLALEHAAPRRVCLYAASHGGSSAMLLRLTIRGGEPPTLSPTSCAQALEQRILHTPAAFKVVCERRQAARRSGFGWAYAGGQPRPSGAYYLRAISVIGQREYERVALNVVPYAVLVVVVVVAFVAFVVVVVVA